jgi:hypothetical protein
MRNQSPIHRLNLNFPIHHMNHWNQRMIKPTHMIIVLNSWFWVKWIETLVVCVYCSIDVFGRSSASLKEFERPMMKGFNVVAHALERCPKLKHPLSEPKLKSWIQKRNLSFKDVDDFLVYQCRFDFNYVR